MFVSLSQNATDSHKQSECVAEIVLIMPLASDTKLKWFTVYFIAKTNTAVPRIQVFK